MQSTTWARGRAGAACAAPRSSASWRSKRLPIGVLVRLQPHRAVPVFRKRRQPSQHRRDVLRGELPNGVRCQVEMPGQAKERPRSVACDPGVEIDVVAVGRRQVPVLVRSLRQ